MISKTARKLVNDAKSYAQPECVKALEAYVERLETALYLLHTGDVSATADDTYTPACELGREIAGDR